MTDLRALETPLPQSQPPPAEEHRESVPGWLTRRIPSSDKLSPINQRRLANFKANRRGYLSLRIFLALFFVTLFAEFLANDRPLLMSYKGELLSPVLTDYPESKFGGFLAITDYKDPVILDEIKANGWAIWPPISYSYDTINKDYPGRKGGDNLCLGYPAPPPWASSAPLCDAPPDQLARFNAIGNRNWLGLDNQGRDVVARVIYGFRISVLFGLILAMLSAGVGVTAGALQGYFGGRTDLIFQRFLEIWSSVPSLFVLIIISSVLVPGFWTLLGTLLLFEWVNLVGVVRAEFLRARNFEYINAARALGLSHRKIMWKHMLPNAMVATLTFLPFQLSGSIAALTALDFLGLGLPPGSPSLGELLLQGKRHLEAPWLGLTGFFTVAIDAVAADLHRRGRARRARPPQDVSVGAAMASINRALLDVRDLSVAFGRGTMIAADRVSFRIGKGETVALVGESGSGKTVSALSILKPAALSGRFASFRRGVVRRERSPEAEAVAAPVGARRPHLDDLPGADDLAQPAAHHRAAGRRGAPRAPAHGREGRAHARAWSCCTRSASASPKSASTRFRISCRAGSGSA